MATAAERTRALERKVPRVVAVGPDDRMRAGCWRADRVTRTRA
jgi:hypothetical protein